MKQRLLSLHLLLALATLLLTRAVSAQDYMSDTRAPKPVVWSGTDRDGGMIPGYPYEALNDTELLEALAVAQSHIEVVRHYQLTEDSLDSLWVRVNLYMGKQTDPQKFASRQSQVQQLRFDLLMATGRFESASEIADYPYFNSKDPIIQDKYLQVQGMNEALTKAIFAEAESPAWDERRARVAVMLSNNNSGVPQDGLTAKQSSYLLEHFGMPSQDLLERIERSLLDGNGALPKSLGLRAAPSLARLTLMDLEGNQNNYTLDPFLILADIDAPGAARIATDYFDNSGQGFRLRVLAALEYVNPFIHHSDWDYPEPRMYSNGNVSAEQVAPRCLVAYWIPVVSKLTSDSRTRSRITKRLSALASRGALSQDLQNSLIDALNDANPKGSIELFQSIRTEPSNASNRPVLAAMLNHRNPRIRNVAAQDMLDFENPIELYSHAKHPDPEVRSAVAESLLGRRIPGKSFRNPQVPASSGDYIPAHVDASTAGTLATLLRDADPAIRRIAANALCREEWEFEDGTPYLYAAREADGEIAEALLRAPILDSKIKTEVAETLAKSNRSEVLAELDDFLVERADYEASTEIWAPILLMRVEDARHPFIGSPANQRRQGVTLKDHVDGQLSSQLRRGLGSSVQGLSTAIRIALARDSSSVLGPCTSYSPAVQALGTISEAEFVQVLELAVNDIRLLEDDRVQAKLENALRLRIPGIQNDRAFRQIIEGNQSSQSQRLKLAALYNRAGYPEIEKSIFGILSNEPLEAGPTPFKSVGNTLSTLDAGRQAAIAAQANAMLDENPREALAALQNVAFYDGAPTEYALRILSPAHHEILSNADARRLLDSAYQFVLESGWSEQAQAHLISALQSEDEVIWYRASEAAQSLQDPALIPVIGEALRSTPDGNKQLNLTRLLGSYMNREAGQELVACIGSARTDNVRQTISMALSEIRTYLEQETYWAGDSKPRATQDEAVRQLAEMLSSEDAKIRVEAIEGLVSFRANEYMPQFILLLKDDNSDVRKAARRALDRLQGKPPSEPIDD